MHIVSVYKLHAPNCSDGDLHEYMETLLAPGQQQSVPSWPSSPPLATKLPPPERLMQANKHQEPKAVQHIADLLDELSLSSSGSDLEMQHQRSQQPSDDVINNSFRPQSASPTQIPTRMPSPQAGPALHQPPTTNIIEADDFFAALSSDFAVSSIPSDGPGQQEAISEAVYSIPMSDQLPNRSNSNPSDTTQPTISNTVSPSSHEATQPTSDRHVTSSLSSFHAASAADTVSHHSSHSSQSATSQHSGTDTSFPSYVSEHSKPELVRPQLVSSATSQEPSPQHTEPERRPYPTARMAYKTAASCIAHTVVPPEALHGMWIQT
jgi:hypothetical protein